MSAKKIIIPTFKFALTEGLGDEFLPTRGSARATGWDVRAATDVVIQPGEYAKIPLGFRMLAPDGWWMECRPRSSTFAKKQLHALYGVIDEDYEGQAIFACQYLPEPDQYKFGHTARPYGELPNLEIKAGDAIGQFIPVERQEMVVERATNEELDALYKQRDFARGTGGFGSTG